LAAQAVEDRQHECGGLAGPGLGRRQDVTTGEDVGDRLGLDGGRGLVALFRDHADEVGRQAE
jgi:hypothetical protein